VHPGFLLWGWLSISLVSSLAAKGKGATAKGGRKGAQTKVFARKKFWRRAFHPLDGDPTVLRPALRVRTHGGWLHHMNRMHTPDTAERRGGLKATARPARSGRRDRNGRSKPGVDLSHQTLATARNPKGFGGDWPVRSSCLAEWGPTTEPLRGSGAEGGQRPARSSGSGHQKTAADEKGNPLDSGVFREFYDRVSEPTPTQKAVPIAAYLPALFFPWPSSSLFRGGGGTRRRRFLRRPSARRDDRVLARDQAAP